MTPWLRRLHKWVGLVIALQFLVWLGSGLTMSLLDQDTVAGGHHQAASAPTPRWPPGMRSPAQVLADAARPVQNIDSHWLAGRPVYRLAHKADVWLVDAQSGRPVEVTPRDAAAIAVADYIGDGRPSEAELLPEPTLEARGHAGPIWRIDFSDDDRTTLYVSGRDGRILERRNDTWRLFDIVWMLHIMDYAGRQNFNNPLVVMAASGGLWMALSGVWLLVASLRMEEFVPPRWRPRRELTVFDAEGNRLRSVESHSGDTVYLALGRQGLQLPSNCGGGQSCGLCEVRVRGHAPPPTSADRAHLTSGRLKLGYRLACNLPVRADGGIEVAGGAALWTERVAEVTRVTAVTPFLREIVLAPAASLGPEFQPGAYVQVHVPPYRLRPHDIVHPEHHDDWSGLDLPPALACKAPVRRSYSLALPVAADGRITLLVRFSPGRTDRKRQPAGKGSTYLYGLKPGDAVRFSGPFGDFALKPGANEKVFIGGGAGMAPLRAMIHALLDGGATERIHYWYGARSRREAPYVDEMAELARRHANFTWHLVLSDETPEEGGAIGGMVHEAAHEHLLRMHPELQRCEFYLCGPPAMLAATRRMLEHLGIDGGRIAFDDFKI